MPLKMSGTLKRNNSFPVLKADPCLLCFKRDASLENKKRRFEVTVQLNCTTGVTSKRLLTTFLFFLFYHYSIFGSNSLLTFHFVPTSPLPRPGARRSRLRPFSTCSDLSAIPARQGSPIIPACAAMATREM